VSVLHEESNRVSAVLIMLQELSKTHNLMSDYIIYSFYCINYKTILIWSLYTPIIDLVSSISVELFSVNTLFIILSLSTLIIDALDKVSVFVLLMLLELSEI